MLIALNISIWLLPHEESIGFAILSCDILSAVELNSKRRMHKRSVMHRTY